MEFPSREAAVENYVGKGPFRTWPREWIEAYVEGGTVDTEQGTVRLSCDRVWESASFSSASINPYRDLKKLQCPITLIAREHDGPPFTHFMTMEHPEIARAEIERMAQTARSELG
jgi:hypothetical protein